MVLPDCAFDVQDAEDLESCAESPRSCSLDGLRSPDEAWFAGDEPASLADRLSCEASACLHPVLLDSMLPGLWGAPAVLPPPPPPPLQPADSLLLEPRFQPLAELPLHLETPVAPDPEDLRGRVWELSRSAEACREVQAALARADGPTAAALACELRGHVWEAVACPHANHVLQRCIRTLRPVPAWLVEEILAWGRGGVVELAEHRFGCRVLERLLESCEEGPRRRLGACLLEHLGGLSRHPFANYCVQHLLQYGAPEHQARILQASLDEVATLATDYHGGGVVTRCMASGPRASRLELAEALLERPSLLERMAVYRFSHGAVIEMLKLGETAPRVRRLLAGKRSQLAATRYGREVLRHL